MPQIGKIGETLFQQFYGGPIDFDLPKTYQDILEE
jgi:hypothetical protein